MSSNQESLTTTGAAAQQRRSGETGRLSSASRPSEVVDTRMNQQDLGGFLDEDDTSFADMVNSSPVSASNEAPRDDKQGATAAVNDVDSQEDEDDDGPDLYTQLQDDSTPVLPRLHEGQTRVTIAIGNTIVSEELSAVRQKVYFSVKVLGTVFEGSIVESQEEKLVLEDEDSNVSGPLEGGEEEDEVDESDAPPIYPAGKKGATEIEEMSQRIEALALKVTQMVTLPNNTHVGLPTSVETFRAAVEQIRTALDQHKDEDTRKSVITKLKEDTLRPAVIKVIADMIEKGPYYYHSIDDSTIANLKAEAFAILSSHVSSVLSAVDALRSPLAITEDTLIKSMRLAWEAEFVYQNYTFAAWEYKRQIVTRPQNPSLDQEGWREYRQRAWLRYSAFLRRCTQQNVAAEHALREAVMLGYNRELREMEGITDPLVNLIKAINLHVQEDIEGCHRYLGLAARDEAFFRGVKTEQQIFDKLRSVVLMQELLLMMEDRLYDGAEHREDELATGHVAEHSPRSTDDPDPSTACLGLLVNLLPPSSMSFFSHVFRRWCEFHHLVAVSLANKGRWDKAAEVLDRVLAIEPQRKPRERSLLPALGLTGTASIAEVLIKAATGGHGLQEESNTGTQPLRLLAVLRYTDLLLKKKKWTQAQEFLMVTHREAKKALSMALGLADTSRLPTLSGELTSGHPMLHADCWGLMSLVLLRDGQPCEDSTQQSRECFDLYMLNEPVNVQVLTEVGFAWLSRGMPSLAEVAACRALELDASGPAHWLYGCTLCEQKDVRQGLLELQTAIGLLWDDEIQRAEIVADAEKYLQTEGAYDPPMMEAIHAANKVGAARHIHVTIGCNQVAQKKQDSTISATATY
ncbi:hypothetical protein Pmar_PMAR029121 [Perkinsus marinus ATCC 50983]|uniref:Uncharacterized protein n=1 Tax=Perkinsus marinus (strain ATCC 50983 / TXsc) TaxID=423536 RepID=C5M0N9_PERM5|nr:hypothetical protein Pmar_PMAR029121 [Perkinsus marinus ATCC 50983]EEQ97397.1 hypothetical protein Pmar_PMAR029121 [Perkinsus marinus ATCC 50983]|eukprot:XP_002764680.1 hypothetical protein Pmar_PMAR029121 [Perkinsus marinus ATCC 50983]